MDEHDPTDEAHQPFDKHVQPGTDLDADDRTEIPDHLKDDLWADACTAEQFREGLEALNALSDEDLVAVQAHHDEQRAQGLRS